MSEATVIIEVNGQPASRILLMDGDSLIVRINGDEMVSLQPHQIPFGVPANTTDNAWGTCRHCPTKTSEGKDPAHDLCMWCALERGEKVDV